jgi:hypothetical protein
MFLWMKVPPMESPSCHRRHTRRRGGRPNRSKARAYKSPSAWPLGLVGSTREASKSAGCSVSEPGSPEISGPREVDCGVIESAEAIGDGRRPVSGTEDWVLNGARALRGRRGRHADKEHPVKARNLSRARVDVRPGEDCAYNRQCREVAGCRREGQMGSIKC